jgi:Dyp-type peroxidase family
MVYRELDQDVPAFRDYVRSQAQLCGLSGAVVEAKMVGRWADGTPLMLSPDAPRSVPGYLKDPRINDFTYRDDPDGVRCPLGSHIRRANPRDSLGFGERMSRRHRMIRRGMPYGHRYRAGRPGADAERGLAFVCFVANIRRQFEFIQSQWCNDGNAFSLGWEPDPMVGRSVGEPSGEASMMTLPGSPTRVLSPLPDVVRTGGGEYFYLPGLEGLRGLSGSRGN